MKKRAILGKKKARLKILDAFLFLDEPSPLSITMPANTLKKVRLYHDRSLSPSNKSIRYNRW